MCKDSRMSIIVFPLCRSSSRKWRAMVKTWAWSAKWLLHINNSLSKVAFQWNRLAWNWTAMHLDWEIFNTLDACEPWRWHSVFWMEDLEVNRMAHCLCWSMYKEALESSRGQLYFHKVESNVTGWWQFLHQLYVTNRSSMTRVFGCHRHCQPKSALPDTWDHGHLLPFWNLQNIFAIKWSSEHYWYRTCQYVGVCCCI